VHPSGFIQFQSIGLQERRIRATTIICVRLNNQTVVMGDGQVSLGSMVVKPNARKVRRLGADGAVVAGIAGATADAMTLLERLEQQMEQYPGQLKRACVEMAKMWRTDKYLRPLEATMIVADQHTALEITGRGDVLEPADGVIGIGSGSPYAIGTHI
jgi:ATP-dependent HslUV protease subunit HslV